MDFQLTEAQEDLRQATRSLREGRLGLDVIRRCLEKPLDRYLWAQVADAGVLSLCRREADGGLALGLTDAAVVFHELGRGIVPGPLAWTLLAGTLERPPAPDAVVGGVDLGPRHSFADGGLPDGTLLEHAGDLDMLLLLDAEGVHTVPLESVDARPATALDPLTSVAVLRALDPGDTVASPDVAGSLRRSGAVLAAAQLSGIAAELCDLSAAYSNDRRQFGRPIGSFQAIKHTLADMWVRAELAWPQVLFAAASLDEGRAEADRAAAAAKVVAGAAAVANGHAAVQIHGGMGYTWEADPHLFLKRAWVLDVLFGSPDDHAAAIGSALG